jgi:hypothetical protein
VPAIAGYVTLAGKNSEQDALHYTAPYAITGITCQHKSWFASDLESLASQKGSSNVITTCWGHAQATLEENVRLFLCFRNNFGIWSSTYPLLKAHFRFPVYYDSGTSRKKPQRYSDTCLGLSHDKGFVFEVGTQSPEQYGNVLAKFRRWAAGLNAKYKEPAHQRVPENVIRAAQVRSFF